MSQKAEVVGDLGDVAHAAADDGDLAAELLREIDDLLQAVNGGTEGGDEEAAFGAVEDVFEARADGAFGFGIAGPIGIGGVRHEQQHAALAVFGESVQVEELVIGGSGIDLEIAGVDDDAERSGDGERDGADDGVGDVDELDLERTDGRLSAWA